MLAATSAAAPERDAPRGRGLFDYSEEDPDEDDKPKIGPAHSLAQETTALEEEEEKKAKPLLEMRYQGRPPSFFICLFPNQADLPSPQAFPFTLRSSSLSSSPTPSRLRRIQCFAAHLQSQSHRRRGHAHPRPSRPQRQARAAPSTALHRPRPGLPAPQPTLDQALRPTSPSSGQ